MEEGLGTLESPASVLILLPLLIIEVGGGMGRLKLIERERCVGCGLDLKGVLVESSHSRTVSIYPCLLYPLGFAEPRLWLRVERSRGKVGVSVVAGIVGLLSGSWIIDDASMLQMVQDRVHLVLNHHCLSVCGLTDLVIYLDLTWRSYCCLSQLQTDTWLLPALCEVGCPSILIGHLLVL